jgi:hypothetical protein
MFFFRTLDQRATDLLQALARGATLKAHRDIDGGKVHRLHALNGDVHEVPAPVVNTLKRRGLIDSNKKFPAATYLLTKRGRQVVTKLLHDDVRTLSSRT